MRSQRSGGSAPSVHPATKVGINAHIQTRSERFKTNWNVLGVRMDDVHIVWLILIGIFVFIAIGVVALSLLPVRDRR